MHGVDGVERRHLSPMTPRMSAWQELSSPLPTSPAVYITATKRQTVTFSTFSLETIFTSIKHLI